MYASRENLTKLNYLDMKLLLDRKAIENKRGTLTNKEINYWSKRFTITQQKVNSNRA